ncbi:MAG: hypothetical protein HFJ04_05415 [Lachnospiraceae bacterium]|nr:hypothetical protein [Lachnospiraceae bacterium]
MSKNELSTTSEHRMMKFKKDELGNVQKEISDQALEAMLKAGTERFECAVNALSDAYSEKIRAMEESEKRSMTLDAAAIQTYNHAMDFAYEKFADQVDLSRPETVDTFLKFSDNGMGVMNNIYEQNRISNRERAENEIMKGRSSILRKVFKLFLQDR